MGLGLETSSLGACKRMILVEEGESGEENGERRVEEREEERRKADKEPRWADGVV